MKFNLLSSVSSLAIGGILTAALPNVAQATLTCPVIVSGQAGSCYESVDLGTHKTNFTASGTLDFFNPANVTIPSQYHELTLQSVVLSESGSITSNGNLVNNSGGLITITFSGGLNLSLVGGTGAPSGFPSSFQTTASGETTTHYQLTASSSLLQVSRTLMNGASYHYNQSGSFTPIPYSANNIGSFIGSGTFSFNALASANNILGYGGGNLSDTVQTTADPLVKITYNYTVSTPEPASLALMGVGLVGAAVVRRRRKA